MQLILGSASPARLATLRAAGVEPEVIVSGVDEDGVVADNPAMLAFALAALKGEAVASRVADEVASGARVLGLAESAFAESTLAASETATSAAVSTARVSPDHDVAEPTADPGDLIAVLVVGADSVLEFDGQPMGKPGRPELARERWRAMRGQTGILHTGHHVAGLDADGSVVASRTEVASTTVWFADLDDAEIDAYVATGEPLQVAGGFTVDGLGGPFIDRIDGDFHNVVGLSLPLLRRVLDDWGIGWHRLRA